MSEVNSNRVIILPYEDCDERNLYYITSLQQDELNFTFG